ncbi:MAG: PDZ domain-containing protein [Acidobacteria bacterium]|nr:PDZ domain-containing protein [Acidobacteriota bacterium]
MAGKFSTRPTLPARALVWYLVLAGVLCCSGNAFGDDDEQPNLVRVNFVTRTIGGKNTVEINGKPMVDYRPVIIQAFSATGMVLDDKGHIMTFLGYRWLDLHGSERTIDVSDGKGGRWEGSLVGIDQSNGVAVIRLIDGRLTKTRVCGKCEIKDGATVMTPVPRGRQIEQFARAEIVSVETGAAMGGASGGWVMMLDRPFPDIGQPILTTDNRVLGFIAGQDLMGLQNVVYPINGLLDSAERILKKGGDVRTGWLGIFLVDAELAMRSGVLVEAVEPDSPAHRAGLAPQDFLFKYNGHKIKDSRQLIHLVQNTPVGSEAKIEIIRKGTPLTITAPIENRRLRSGHGKLSFNLPELPAEFSGKVAEQASVNQGVRLGLDTILLTPSLADALQMPGRTGLLVIDVARQTPAQSAGVLVGDVITSIDGLPITDTSGFESYLLERNWGSQVILKVLRRGEERTIAISLEKQNTRS